TSTSATSGISHLFFFFFLVAFLSAGPIVQKPKGDGKYVSAAAHRKLVRNRRNISWYKQNSDFWGWYKYFTENGNQEAVQEMDRIYLAYLQNKNRAEGRRSYKAYLRHLGDVYKSCSDSDDPDCVSSYTSRPKPTPEAPKPAPVKTCDPTKDAYCLYAALVQGKSPYLPLALPAAAPAPAPVKAPAPLYVLFSSSLNNTIQPFLPISCLQYHLRAAHGHAPSAGPLPSYAHLGCDPSKDPSCKPKLVQKASSGLYLQYPNCDPLRDPLCAHTASLVVSGPGSCNPLYEEGCNPLTATRFANPPKAYQNEKEDEAAALPQGNNPYQFPFPNPNYEEPTQEERHPLGPPGKTKEGYECFVGYDRECTPVKPTEPRSGVHRRIPYPAEAYEPHLNADGTRSGVLEPSNPHCDPEYDRDCRLRRYEPQPEAQPELYAEEDHSQGAVESEQPEQPEQEQYEAEPYQSGQEEPHMSYQPLSQGMPSLQDILRRYGDQYPEQEDHRAYADDYRKK
uniref:Actinodin1 n=1 Tax=Cyclopterus lumpus TaxID=8103 RepID=A0A8C2Z6E0_CYCLU